MYLQKVRGQRYPMMLEVFQSSFEVNLNPVTKEETSQFKI